MGAGLGALSVVVSFVVALGLAYGCESPPLSTPPPLARRPPDVIVVMIDTLRPDHLSLNGYHKRTSPALADFAATADHYRHAYAQSSWTPPSVASFLTSRYPREVGVRSHPQKLRYGTRTLAKVLQARGYRTEGVSTNRFITRRYGHDVGYDRFDDRHAGSATAVTSHLVTDLALDRVREMKNGESLFLYVHYFDPHYSYTIHEGFELGAPRMGSLVGSDSISFLGMKKRSSLVHGEMVTARDYYDSDIAFTDHQVGRLLSGLRAVGRFDSAVVVVVADHGEEFLDHGGIGHTTTLYNEVVHVPLLIKAPGQTSGRQIDAPVALLDAAPTILDLAGARPEPNHLGVSLRKLGERRPIFMSTFRPTPKIGLVFGGHKAILDQQACNFQLFDLVHDPYEQHSVAQDRPALAAILKGSLESWDEGRFQDQGEAEVRLTGHQRAVMRALGYGE